ncbi:MAG: hypothetical protein IKO68_12330 [Oscillospiraceae bacterium]|nr:hypothetical protein [Oscillospiraceae bacterium]MBR7010328.1 hypothetical protein [Oscillospiraceae bacterium]
MKYNEEDLDIENKNISINKQTTRAKGGGVKVTRPKTSTSIRMEPIPQQIDTLIKEDKKSLCRGEGRVIFVGHFFEGGKTFPELSAAFL